MGKFANKCKQLFRGKASGSKSDSPKPARNVLRKVRRGVLNSVDGIAEATEDSRETRALIQDASDAGISEPVDSSVEQTRLQTSTSDLHISPEQPRLTNQDELSPKDCVPPEGTPDKADQTAGPPIFTTESDVQGRQLVPEVIPNGEESRLAEAQQDHHPLDITVIASPPDLTDSPKTSNGGSQARYTSSCYSTPTPKSRFHRNLQSCQSPETTYLRTPHDSNSYIKLLDDSFGLSTPAETPDRCNTVCNPPSTIAETLGVFERSVGKGHQGSDPFLSFFDEQNKEKGEATGPVERVAESTVVEQPAQETAHEDSESPNDRASIKSESPCAWERAMESQKQSFQIEIEDLKEDHAAEIGELKERIAKQEKEPEAAKKRKAYVEKIANKKITDIKKAKDADETYYLGLWDAAECTMADKIWEKNEQLEQKDAMIKRQNEWAATMSTRISELKHDVDDAKLHVIRPLEQEVARLTALSREDAQKIADQLSQIDLLRDTQTHIQNSQPQLMIQLEQVCNERDQYRGLYEQINTDLIAAQHDIQQKEQRLNDFNYTYEDEPHPTEAAGLLEKTREAYQSLELKANECLFREQDERKRHEQDKRFWLLENERKQKMIDNLGAKIGLLEKSNERVINDLEQGIVSEHVDDRLPSLYEGSKQKISELQSYISQQELQIAAQDKEIHQHKTTISLPTRTLEEKNVEIQDLQESKIEAERQIEEIQTQSDEKVIVAATELQTATNEIDWYQSQNQNLQSQIHHMVDDGVPATLINTHQAEIQHLQQYNAELEAEIQHHRTQQQNQYNKDWHDANAAAFSERSNEILRLNWENANAEVAKLKTEIAVLRQGAGVPQTNGVSEGQGEECERLQEKLDASTQETQNVVADVFVLRELAGAMWHSLRDTGVRDRDEELLMTLGPVADQIEEVMGRYSDQEVGVEVEEEPELEDYVDDAEGVDPETNGETTAIPARDENSFRIPTSAFRDDWAFSGNNPFARGPGDDGLEENHYTPTMSPPRPGYTFTPPSPSSSDSDSYSSAHTPDCSPLSEGNNIPEAQNQEHETQERVSDTNQDSNTDNQLDAFDAFTNVNNVEFEDDDTPTPTPNNAALVLYNPYNPPEEADEELISQAAYDALFPTPTPYPAEWGHETFYAPSENRDTNREDALWDEFDGVQEGGDEERGDEDDGDEDCGDEFNGVEEGGDEDGGDEDGGDEEDGDEAVLEQPAGRACPIHRRGVECVTCGVGEKR
ncbi:MAG: hypothetical protein L6R36_002251 [Xanthoria steineri]|nr:MAG: hypothetical protein L6R36_002251 [Xanthoria steineri]